MRLSSVRLSEVEDRSCSRPAARAKGVRGELGRPRAREGDRSVMGGQGLAHLPLTSGDKDQERDQVVP